MDYTELQPIIESCLSKKDKDISIDLYLEFPIPWNTVMGLFKNLTKLLLDEITPLNLKLLTSKDEFTISDFINTPMKSEFIEPSSGQDFDDRVFFHYQKRGVNIHHLRFNYTITNTENFKIEYSDIKKIIKSVPIYCGYIYYFQFCKLQTPNNIDALKYSYKIDESYYKEILELSIQNNKELIWDYFPAREIQFDDFFFQIAPISFYSEAFFRKIGTAPFNGLKFDIDSNLYFVDLITKPFETHHSRNIEKLIQFRMDNDFVKIEMENGAVVDLRHLNSPPY